ncbi:MAG TPA: hypothetical protein DDX40_06860 [Rikenellaceae bacterium]|nr:hypothetical protein [Rikenellaceae bacterium]
MTNSKKLTGAGVTAEYGWRFLRAAGLVTVACVGLGLIIGSLNFYLIDNIISPKLSFVAQMAWLSVMGMMFARLVRLPKKMGLIAGIAVCVGIFIYIVLEYAHLGIRAALGSVGIDWFHVCFGFICFVSFCCGMYARTWIGDGLCRRKTARAALVVFLSVIVIRLLDSCSYMMFDRAGYEQTMSSSLRSSLSLFRDLSALAVAFSMAVLARSRAIYRLTRPLVVKGVLVALALIPMLFLVETRDAFVALALSAPYVIAFLMLGPTLARLFVKGVRWF